MSMGTPHHQAAGTNHAAPPKPPRSRKTKQRRMSVGSLASLAAAVAAKEKQRAEEAMPPASATPELNDAGKEILRYLFVRATATVDHTASGTSLTVKGTQAGIKLGVDLQCEARIIGDRPGNVYKAIDLGPDPFPVVRDLLALGLVEEVGGE